MDKINRRFFYYKTKAAYLAEKDRIPREAIVFIEDPRCIVTHGAEYIYDFSLNEITNNITALLNNKQDKLIAGDGISISEDNVISSNLDLNNLSDDQRSQLVELIVQAIPNDSEDDVYTKEYIDNLVAELREEIATSGINLDEMDEEDREAFTNAVIQMISDSQGLDNRYTNALIDSMLASKQDTLAAGTNISINGNVISSTIDDSYAKKDWVTTQINQHSSGSGSAVPTVNNNTIYFGE